MGDVHLLAGDACEGCAGVSFSKWRNWWAEAASFLTRWRTVQAVAKVDDDIAYLT